MFNEPDEDQRPDSPEAQATALAMRWIAEVEAVEKEIAPWVRRGGKVIDIYKDKRGSDRLIEARRFNILWANVQTLAPAIYARTPQGVVSRRFKDADPVGREASEVLERGINYSVEEYDFDDLMTQVRQDYLLPGRGTAWVRYEPTIETVQTEGAEPYDQVTYERVVCDHVAWDDFLHSIGREWTDVTWVSRRVYLTRKELVARFGEEVGSKVPLDWAQKGQSKDEQFKKAVVYEIWDKPSKRAIWVSKGYTSTPLDVREDPLGLTEFFPCPRPLYATLGPDSLIPVPDYVLYQDQAEELNELTARIGKLIDALRLNGFYAGDAKSEIQRAFDPANENKLIPVESWAAFAERGGVKGLIEWLPINMVIECLRGCQEQRRQVIEDIYQITGISDIARGASNPNETATAVSMKAQWGSLRVRDRQKEMARFARDVIRLMGEVIAEKFGVDTLRKMTGVKLLTNEERERMAMQYQTVAQQAQATGQQPTPPPAELQQPTWEEVEALLKDNALRQFRIEIETDSTIEPDEAEQKAAAVEFVMAIGKLIGDSLPAVQQAPPLGKLVAESIKFLTRRYRIGREMEATIDEVVDQISAMPPPQQGGPAPPPDPVAGQVAQIGLQTEQVKQSGELQRAQIAAQTQSQRLPVEIGELQLKNNIAQRDLNPQVIG